MQIYIGCAGWSLRKEWADDFPGGGTHLQRYATRLNAVEINSSFYRPHRVATYQRWAESTPDHFRFAVKVPKQITHTQRLVTAEPLLERFMAEVNGLGTKLGPLLVQLPPSLKFSPTSVEAFFQTFRENTDRVIVCEPRHPTWFESDAEALLRQYNISRVAADPSVVPAAAVPGGCKDNVYHRWHGSPQMYYSSYDEGALRILADQLLQADQAGQHAWCIFDNTAEGAAMTNALFLHATIQSAASARKTDSE